MVPTLGKPGSLGGQASPCCTAMLRSRNRNAECETRRPSPPAPRAVARRAVRQLDPLQDEARYLVRIGAPAVKYCERRLSCQQGDGDDLRDGAHVRFVTPPGNPGGVDACITG